MNENNIGYFSPAGNLGNDAPRKESPFSKAGDLSASQIDEKELNVSEENFSGFKKTGNISGGNYFKSAGDLGIAEPRRESPFSRAGDLSASQIDEKELNVSEKDTGYFSPAGNLGNDDPRKESPFSKAGDLSASQIDEKELNVSEKDTGYFSSASGLGKTSVEDYLLTVVSGKKYDNVCELGVLAGAGMTMVDLNQLKKMVDEGYNIVSAYVINADADMIEVEFQRYIYNEELMERRRRF